MSDAEPTVAVLLAGGVGSRLYPASRPSRPKQFCAFGGERTLLRRTADRVDFADAVYAVTRERYADRVADAVPEATVLTDPGLDTGLALAVATRAVAEREAGDPVVCALPTDHHVAGPFARTVGRAVGVARSTDGLVCLGVVPDGPATGFGYVEPARPVAPPEPADGDGAPGEVRQSGACQHARVERFVEKPDAATARSLVDAGCLWNAGVFVWRPAAFERAAADTALGPLVDALADGDPERGFAAVDPVSVDRAVMERTEEAHVVPAAFEWDDLGTWDAVGRHLADADCEGDGANSTLGDATALDASGNVLATDGETHVGVVGADELVVAAYGDRVLVVPRDESERVRDLVAALDSGTGDVAAGGPIGDEPSDGDGEGTA
ncbi:MAG: mannose-1-phosphate guanylyltransferase [Halobacteriaceae archaeon]